MAQQSILDKVREWIGGVAWSIFLWSARMTEEEYFAELDRVAEQRNDAETGTCPACSGVGSYFVGVYRETCSECEGTGHV